LVWLPLLLLILELYFALFVMKYEAFGAESVLLEVYSLPQRKQKIVLTRLLI
jgi:hypothetical protein